MGIEKRFPHSSNEIFVNFFCLIQRWHILLNVQVANFLDDKINKLKMWLKAF